MRPESLIELLREAPFKPFRIFATDGRTYDVRHPDQALVLRSRVILPLPSGQGCLADPSIWRCRTSFAWKKYRNKPPER